MFEELKNPIVTEMLEDVSDYSELDQSQIDMIDKLATIYDLPIEFKDMLCDSYTVYGLTDEEVILIAHLTKTYELDLDQMCHLVFGVTYHMPEDFAILMASLTKKLKLNELQTYYIIVAFQSGLTREQTESFVKVCKQYDLSEIMMSNVIDLYLQNVSEEDIKMQLLGREINDIFLELEFESMLEETDKILKRNNPHK